MCWRWRSACLRPGIRSTFGWRSRASRSALMGLGLVIATMADNVPAVQALGQCIFLPMLIIGGVAVPLESLPDWAQQVSAFFPGRYAVEALNAAVMGDGLVPARFSLFALLLIGAAACVAGARLFRWDAEQRFATVPGKGWVAAALAAWVAVGVAAENATSRGDADDLRLEPAAPPRPCAGRGIDDSTGHSGAGAAGATSVHDPRSRSRCVRSPPLPDAARHARGTVERRGERRRTSRANRRLRRTPPRRRAASSLRRHRRGRPRPSTTSTVRSTSPASAGRGRRHADRTRTMKTPTLRLANSSRRCARGSRRGRPARCRIPCSARGTCSTWPPCPTCCRRRSSDSRRWSSTIACRRTFRQAQLIQVLFWIALHPMDGDDDRDRAAAGAGPELWRHRRDETRNRAAFYAVKLLGRLTGRITPK